MKNLLLFAFCIPALQSLNAQVPTVMPPDANAFYDDAMPAIRQQVKSIVLQTANAIKDRKANADSLSQRLRINNALKGVNNNDIDGITVLIMVQASKNVDADLKILVLGMSRTNEQKQQQRTTVQATSVNNAETKASSADEINTAQNLKLRMIAERKSRIAEEVSLVMKKISGTQQDIINNLK